VFTLLSIAQLVAFLFAGVWYVSQSLVQLMIWRFSIYLKLLSCIGAAWLVCDARLLRPWMTRAALYAIPLAVVVTIGAAVAFGDRLAALGTPEPALAAFREHRAAFALFAGCAFVPGLLALIERRGRRLSTGASLSGIALCVVLAVAGWHHWLGWGMTPEHVDPDYLKVCHWAEQSTPIDAVFLVPPAETAFRLEARRAIVVNFKHVPQLGSEILVWLERLEDVLGTSDLAQFPRDYLRTLHRLDECYNARPPDELISVARKYGARYVVVERAWDARFRPMLVYRPDSGRYFVYDCSNAAKARQ
jgi:hypothetical protein